MAGRNGRQNSASCPCNGDDILSTTVTLDLLTFHQGRPLVASPGRGIARISTHDGSRKPTAVAASTVKSPAVYFPTRKFREVSIVHVYCIVHQYASQSGDCARGIVLLHEQFLASPVDRRDGVSYSWTLWIYTHCIRKLVACRRSITPVRNASFSRRTPHLIESLILLACVFFHLLFYSQLHGHCIMHHVRQCCHHKYRWDAELLA
jgi:hypothetical protein